MVKLSLHRIQWMKSEFLQKETKCVEEKNETYTKTNLTKQTAVDGSPNRQWNERINYRNLKNISMLAAMPFVLLECKRQCMLQFSALLPVQKHVWAWTLSKPEQETRNKNKKNKNWQFTKTNASSCVNWL